MVVLFFVRSGKQFKADFTYRSLPSIAGISTSRFNQSIDDLKAGGAEIVKEISRRGRKFEESSTAAAAAPISPELLFSGYWQELKSDLDKQTEEVKRALILKGLEKLGYREVKLGGENNSVSTPCLEDKPQ